MFPPSKILVTSDDNELRFDHAVPSRNGKEVNQYGYIYTKSVSKLDMVVYFTETELKKYLSNNIFKEIE